VGNAGIGLATFVLFVLMALVAVPVIIAAAALSPALAIVVGVSLLGGYLCLILVSSALNGIYCTALYRFATTGDPGQHFNPEMMRQAFRPRKARW
jgi:hypothetical protein